MGVAVEFCDVVKRFPSAEENAVDHVSFQVKEGELITILGTSGCGKTTLMKMVNRLYEPTSGTIRVFGEDIMQTDAVNLRRKIGYVIQQVGLFPHMTVENCSRSGNPWMGGRENLRACHRASDTGQSGTGDLSKEISIAVVRRTAAACRTCPCSGSASIHHASGRAVWSH